VKIDVASIDSRAVGKAVKAMHVINPSLRMYMLYRICFYSLRLILLSLLLLLLLLLWGEGRDSETML